MGAIVRNRQARALVVAAALVSLSGCSSSGDDSTGQAAASCAKQVKYESRTYESVANTPITVGKELSSVAFTPCDDTGGRAGNDEEPTKMTAFTVKGLATDVAIAVGDNADEAKLFAVKSGKDLPPEVEKFIDES